MNEQTDRLQEIVSAGGEPLKTIMEQGVLKPDEMRIVTLWLMVRFPVHPDELEAWKPIQDALQSRLDETLKKFK